MEGAAGSVRHNDAPMGTADHIDPVAPDTGTFDLVAVGETMVAFVSQGGSRDYLAVAAGAESNVAIGMARLGCRTKWVSRLGADRLGSLIEESVVGAGVAVDAVRDNARPTGVMTVHVEGPERATAYYRSQSAAQAMSPDDLHRVGPTGWIHVTGITPAVSASAAALVEVVLGKVGHRARVSFDVNYRPTLWPDVETARRVLLSLARAADIVFVGDDEAQALFGTCDIDELSALILRRSDQQVVLKRGPGVASVIELGGVTSESALPAEILDVTGAGDAFAAGYLAATVFNWPLRSRLRLGHVMGSRAVATLEHVPRPFSDDEFSRISQEWLTEHWPVETAT
jgi:2-dehydro-3-deoxygluconokinase